jgi:hypothetical protein
MYIDITTIITTQYIYTSQTNNYTMYIHHNNNYNTKYIQHNNNYNTIYIYITTIITTQYTYITTIITTNKYIYIYITNK